jgi:aryl-alcohol dehydrogenase-like predicted oxidoreductase
MWIGAQEDESIRALHRAIELGVNFIDTARGYGESERIVGQVVREHPRETLYIATKVPPKNGIWPAPGGLDLAQAFPGDHIRASLETSLRASGLEAFDVLQFHVWSDEWVGRGDWLETIEDLKKEGKIRFFGVSINDYQPESVLELVGTGHVDTHRRPHRRPRHRNRAGGRDRTALRAQPGCRIDGHPGHAHRQERRAERRGR